MRTPREMQTSSGKGESDRVHHRNECRLKGQHSPVIHTNAHAPPVRSTSAGGSTERPRVAVRHTPPAEAGHTVAPPQPASAQRGLAEVRVVAHSYR